MSAKEELKELGRTVMRPLAFVYVVLLVQLPILIYVFVAYRNQLPNIYDGLRIQNIYNYLIGVDLSLGVLLLLASLFVSYVVSLLYILTGGVRFLKTKPGRQTLLSSVFNVIVSFEFLVVPFYLYVTFEDIWITALGVLAVVIIFKLPRRFASAKLAYPVIGVISVLAVFLFPVTPIYELVTILLITATLNGLRDDARTFLSRLIEDYDFAMNLYIQQRKTVDMSQEYHDIEDYEEIKEDIKEKFDSYRLNLAFSNRKKTEKVRWTLPLLPVSMLALFVYLDMSILPVLYVVFWFPVLLHVTRIVTYTPPLFDIQLKDERIGNALLLEEHYDKGYIEILHETGQRRLFTDSIVDMKRRSQADLSKRREYDSTR